MIQLFEDHFDIEYIKEIETTTIIILSLYLKINFYNIY